MHYQQTANYRYSCLRQSVYYGEKSCQNVKGSPLDALVVEKVLRALEPTSLELSLQAAEDIQNERQRLHANW